jgi:hypothetical protein
MRFRKPRLLEQMYVVQDGRECFVVPEHDKDTVVQYFQRHCAEVPPCVEPNVWPVRLHHYPIAWDGKK